MPASGPRIHLVLFSPARARFPRGRTSRKSGHSSLHRYQLRCRWPAPLTAESQFSAVSSIVARRLGGQAGKLGETFPHGTDGRALAARLAGQVSRDPAITVFTGAAVTAKSGTFGNYQVTVTAGDGQHAPEVGQIIVATGSASYQPEAGEFGYGIDGVLTLPEFRTLLDRTAGPLTWAGRPVRSIAYIYCVGNRTAARPHCSRFCCTAAVYCSLLAARHGDGIRQYHLYRDLRTYGQNEQLLTESRERGSVYLKFADDYPPGVARDGDGLVVTVRDQLCAGEELLIPADLEVLAERGLPRAAPQAGRVVIHDSCLYARAGNVIEAPRDLLAAAGLTVAEPGRTRERTWCCGGPAEALYPDKAAAVAAARVAQLRTVAPDCVTMCPLCLVNLRKAANGTLRVRDISEYLHEGAA